MRGSILDPSSSVVPVKLTSCSLVTFLTFLSSSLIASSSKLLGSFPDSQLSTAAWVSSPTLYYSLIAHHSQPTSASSQLQFPSPSTALPPSVLNNSLISYTSTSSPAPPSTALPQPTSTTATAPLLTAQSSGSSISQHPTLQPSASQPPIIPVPQPLSLLV
ncbi:hypothetical protein BJV74DRAFT_889832 [Russula compacta]|nr:hypothetical protein BJV74DRAFT_889832 [Russula compacta]